MWGGWAVGTYEMIFANRIQWDGELYEQQRGCLEKVKAVDLHRALSHLRSLGSYPSHYLSVPKRVPHCL